MNIHSAPDDFGRKSSTEVKWAEKDEQQPKQYKTKELVSPLRMHCTFGLSTHLEANFHSLCHIVDSALYLNEGLDAGLEDHVGVEQKGAQERLRVAGQLGYDTREQDVDVQRVLEHVFQLGKQNHDERTLTRREGVSE